jgi:hypothetical protein
MRSTSFVGATGFVSSLDGKPGPHAPKASALAGLRHAPENRHFLPFFEVGKRSKYNGPVARVKTYGANYLSSALRISLASPALLHVL